MLGDLGGEDVGPVPGLRGLSLTSDVARSREAGPSPLPSIPLPQRFCRSVAVVTAVAACPAQSGGLCGDRRRQGRHRQGDPPCPLGGAGEDGRAESPSGAAAAHVVFTASATFRLRQSKSLCFHTKLARVSRKTTYKAPGLEDATSLEPRGSGPVV